ncbi:RecBCD enzyme subunit RecB [Flexivirga endophytica]|uniref:RecBCD enzyme subunit RecB n=1 Tax=Flexivirga endophytica TaxID=1849103 RepID=A0A916SZV0_9MICO|nr:UvrD-helicase domain-containing protein [Flexivirga endophytica]GGB24010.1 RecBCD enzyme subunit RecB [Flexivirga endophytica]GHB57964.1 RecBCD enzyme subunit RecB [Flexivirga endophytica]
MTPLLDEPFDIHGPLPTGTTVLEASAGTGKTWTIAALVTRYVAEGVHTLDELLVVTFGRAASRELRERVREQLVACAEALDDPDAIPTDPLLVTLRDVDPAERATRARRVRDALAAFDEATIATIHQFCHQVLRGLGIAGDTDAGATLVEDVDDLLMEVVDDLYLRGFARQESRPEFDLAEARRIARRVAGDPSAQLVPLRPEPNTPAARRVGFARAVRGELARRKRRLGVLTYDDLLSQVADALRDPDGPARERLRRQWKVVLIDEFQDTDPVQWEVFDRAFRGHATMVLIGDPKQAIYAFRGGDVTTYLQAAHTAGVRRTLGTNWRSDAPLVAALGRFLTGAALGDPEILVHPVTASHTETRLVGAPEPAPFRIRLLGADQVARSQLLKDDAIRAAAYRERAAQDAAHDIARLLGSNATYDDSGHARPIRPSDIAVLASRNDHLALMQQQLREVGVPAVLSGAGSVFRTPAARAWRILLEAMDQPHRSARIRAAALTPFIGKTATELDADSELLTEQVTDRVRWLASVYERRGIAAVFEICNIDGLPARVLAEIGGERELTDLRHIAEALHAVSMERASGLPALLAWLQEQAEQDRPASGDARARRLDSDAQAVQLLTIHGSKGLEFPIVYLPFVADRWVSDDDNPLFHAPGDPPRRSIYVGQADREAGKLARQEDAGESLRLLYVALTRAKSQVVAWWGPSNNAPDSAIHRMLIDRDPAAPTAAGAIADSRGHRSETEAGALLQRWSDAGGPQWERVTKAGSDPVRSAVAATDLTVRRFTRVIDEDWRRTSYSALSRVLEQLPAADGVSSEPDADVKNDELLLEHADRVAGEERDRVSRSAHLDSGLDRESPMATLPVGATFGSLVHAVLETADPTATDLAAELTTRVHEQLVRWPVDVDVEVLVDALVRVYDTPLGPLAGGVTLRSVGRNKLAELDFELPLGAQDGDERVRLGQLAAILRRHLAAGDPLLPYAELLDNELLGGQVLRGYLTGSIDVVLRVGERYLVADYKTNWLGPADESLLLGAYGPEPLAAAMGHSDYPLQALLYAATLHRYLRWRLPDYDPERHLGGVLYLYLRGMAGADSPVVEGNPTGVFSWSPPAALVLELSDLLDGEGGV